MLLLKNLKTATNKINIMEIKFLKKDFWLAVLAGEIVAWLSLPTLKNIKVLELLAEKGISNINFAILWAIFVPVGAVSGLVLFYLLAKTRNRLGFWQLGKYAVVGTLNTVLNAGVYNFFIFTTNVAIGLSLDAYFVVAFIVTVINSFFWNKYWSFERKKDDSIKQEALDFFTVSIAVAIVNAVLIHIIVNVIKAPQGIDQKIWANMALLFTVATAFLGNFFGYKYIVFKKRK
jgi:putative flippase GtrA